MIQRDKIMEQLMFKKITPDFFIDRHTAIRTDDEGKVISSSDTYRVSPSTPTETMEDAANKQIELNANANRVSIWDTDINPSHSIWNEVCKNLDKYLEEFFKEKQQGKKRVSANTIKNMRSGFRYLKLFCFENKIPDLKHYKYIQNIMEMWSGNLNSY